MFETKKRLRKRIELLEKDVISYMQSVKQRDEKIRNLAKEIPDIPQILENGFDIKIFKTDKVMHVELTRNGMTATYGICRNYLDYEDIVFAIMQAKMNFLRVREQEIEKLIAIKKSG